jgi:Zn-dependent protease with chaperone function
LSLRTRALIAVLLTAGFYALALGMLALCGLVIWASLTAKHISFYPAIASGIAMVAIVRGVIPRRIRFEPPGPRLYAVDHPNLFRAIADVARATGQPIPQEVYLVGSVNAAVMVDKPVIGMHARRILIIGLPMLQAVTVAQLRAVLAHEFGHYAAGDTALSSWIYRTRLAIERTLHHLGSGLLMRPFLWYGNFFMRVSQAISRSQELAADRLSAKTAGARNAAEALVATGRASMAWEGYWNGNVAPILDQGYRPPISAGFAQYLAAPPVITALDSALGDVMRTRTVDPYDTHPPLPERIRLLKTLPAGKPSQDDPPAIGLVHDVETLEKDLLAMVVRPASFTLKPIAWSEIGQQVLVPSWRKRAHPHAEVLRTLTTADCERMGRELSRFATRLRMRAIDITARAEEARAVAGCALAVRLIDSGWSVELRPGRPVILTRSDKTIEPFAVVPWFEKGEMTGEAWAATCRDLGIEGLTLA